MCERLNITDFINQIGHEYFIMGNTIIFTEDNDLPKDKKKNVFDSRLSYQGWKKLLILPPDQVKIIKIPFSESITLSYIPNPETLCLLKKRKDCFKFLKNNYN